MQAIRQCSVCAGRAVGGFLQHHSDVSVLRASKSFHRRGAARIHNPSIVEYFPFRSTTSREDTSKASFGVAHGLHAVPFTQQVENLSHNSLIKRAASVVTDSSSTLLSQTSLALVDALTDYSKTVHTRIALQRQYLVSLGKLSLAEQDSLQQAINSLRTEISDRLDECKHLESSWISALNMCKVATEVAITSGAEQASITLRTNIQVAQAQVEEAQKLSTDVNRKLAETKVEEIQRMAEYAAFSSEEHEVHEAYLRED
ncbi:diablo, IAP-binding mitochondrial protein a isoform X1 [Cynoglossus semilaevis]|uniref:diablo, IAP-binding mitochondrial protein a isoform X1 n=1 Tax=Cynoglossus semilaevis TaxID=244447 RepID=UPI0004953BC0|nr:diablo homolog, mitochondrial-like isoform X1 [Cynoglossus semilaevis]